MVWLWAENGGAGVPQGQRIPYGCNGIVCSPTEEIENLNMPARGSALVVFGVTYHIPRSVCCEPMRGHLHALKTLQICLEDPSIPKNFALIFPDFSPEIKQKWEKITYLAWRDLWACLPWSVDGQDEDWVGAEWGSSGTERIERQEVRGCRGAQNGVRHQSSQGRETSSKTFPTVATPSKRAGSIRDGVYQ